MAIGRLSFLDLTPEKRAQAAAAARTRLKTLLDNPFLTEAQVQVLQEKIKQISHWEQGIVYTPPPFKPMQAESDEEIPIELEDPDHV